MNSDDVDSHPVKYRQFARLPVCRASLGRVVLIVVCSVGVISCQPREPVTESAEEESSQAVRLFNGRNLQGWKIVKNKSLRYNSNWIIGYARISTGRDDDLDIDKSDGSAGELVNGRDKGLDLRTERNFADGSLELEFLIPKKAASGVFLLGVYEIRIADSFGEKNLTDKSMGGIPDVAPPRVNASLPAGVWQKLKIDFRAPRFRDGRKIADAVFVSVELNEKPVQENVQISEISAGAIFSQESATGPLMLQGKKSPIAYRNITFTPKK